MMLRYAHLADDRRAATAHLLDDEQPQIWPHRAARSGKSATDNEITE